MTTAPFEMVTFDCYGTLIDWESGLGQFLYDFALRNGDSTAPSGDELRRRWEAIQFEMLHKQYKPYEQILGESLKAWCNERGYPYTVTDGPALVRSMRSWQPFHDTRPSLLRTRAAGMKLAIISNTDRSIISHSLKHIGVPFDEVITAEDCRAYKPSPAVFSQALVTLGIPAGRMLHVAFGFKYDISQARRFGWHTAWVNRNAETTLESTKPDYIWRDLWGLAELAGSPYDRWPGRTP